MTRICVVLVYSCCNSRQKLWRSSFSFERGENLLQIC